MEHERLPGTGGRASARHVSQSSSSHKCTSHLGFSLGCEYYHNDNGRGARIPKSSIDPIVVRNLKDALKQRGRSAYSVATALGHPSNWLHQILNGKSGLLIPSLRKIAEELGVSMGSLVDDGQDIPDTNGQADPGRLHHGTAAGDNQEGVLHLGSHRCLDLLRQRLIAPRLQPPALPRTHRDLPVHLQTQILLPLVDP